MHDEDNDGRFPDQSPVEVRYTRSEQEKHGDRERWPWLPGTIVEQCRPARWSVSIVNPLTSPMRSAVRRFVGLAEGH